MRREAVDWGKSAHAAPAEQSAPSLVTCRNERPQAEVCGHAEGGSGMGQSGMHAAPAEQSAPSLVMC